MNEALAVGFNPVPAAEKVARWHAVIRTRLVMLAIIAIALGALWFWRRDWLADFWYLAAITVVASLGWIVGAWLLWWRAKRDLTRLGDGTALVLDRQGVTVRGQHVPWSGLKALTTRPGKPFESPVLVVEPLQGAALTLPLDYLDRTGGELDNTARAYSQGRFGVDLSGVGV